MVVVESLEYPGLSDAGGGEPVHRRTDFGGQVDTSSTDAIAATTTPGATGVDCGSRAATNLSMISPANTAGMSSTPGLIEPVEEDPRPQ